MISTNALRKMQYDNLCKGFGVDSFSVVELPPIMDELPEYVLRFKRGGLHTECKLLTEFKVEIMGMWGTQPKAHVDYEAMNKQVEDILGAYNDYLWLCC